MSEKFDRLSSFGWMVNVVASKAEKLFDIELKKHGLSIALWPTLMCLWEEEGVSQREIAAKAKVENSTTTRTLDKLEKLGLVERHPDPQSRRTFRIYLTPKGRDLEEVLTPIPLSINQQLLRALNAEEQQQMLALLQKIVSDV
ncbi:MarR family transcriptional regulator [Photobacterium sp. CCB-ST2H9]|uniref:MarR family winged helix-turn-helix transcriptional regulator n=1 Tax=Photobacterium sp. CCB-ST2H9 TaxID=2912855 RepID=UPI0020031A16|nr:MarR family transcriptional regulator [Photobacterium sp. CCB-ST2H9]UTM59136.1 MarR family transcriptional regulator [Photobacterium sp. CCB-ST2H9]